MSENKTNGKEITNRDRWIRDRFNAYILQEGRDDAYLRGLHYFIVSSYGPDNPTRWLPCNAPTKKQIELAIKKNIPISELFKQDLDGSWTRLYRNTLNEYKNLSDYVVVCRLKGVIPWALLQDHKNDEIQQSCYDRTEAELYSVRGSNSGEFDFTFDKMDDWSEYRESINVNVEKPHFWNQEKRLVVIVEKSKSKSEIESLCRRHGADFIQFGGQHSVTRLNQLCKLAEREDKAMRIFHLTDLDIAGWNMPSSVMKRVQEIYPNPEHESIRICLTREQAILWNLPESFDPIKDKDIKSGAIDKFVKETGNSICIELDGVPRDLLITTITDSLSEFSGIEDDENDYEETKTKYNEKYNEVSEDFFDNEPDNVDKAEDYQEKVERFNEIIDEINETIESYSDEMESLKSDLYDIETVIEDDLKEKLLEGEDEEDEDSEIEEEECLTCERPQSECTCGEEEE